MTRREVFLIAGLSVAARIIVVMLIGIRNGVDSVKYIEAATSWRGSGFSLSGLLNESQRSPLFVAIVTIFRAIFEDWRFALVAWHTLVSASLPVLLFARRDAAASVGAAPGLRQC